MCNRFLLFSRCTLSLSLSDNICLRFLQKFYRLLTYCKISIEKIIAWNLSYVRLWRCVDWYSGRNFPHKSPPWRWRQKPTPQETPKRSVCQYWKHNGQYWSTEGKMTQITSDEITPPWKRRQNVPQKRFLSSRLNVVTRQETAVIYTCTTARTATAWTECAENFSWNDLLTEAYKKAGCTSIFITFAA
jgi:hypothetical protein